MLGLCERHLLTEEQRKELDALKAKVEAWEAERERRKDPCGALCRKLNEENAGVTFQDITSPSDMAARQFRVLIEVHVRAELIQQPETVSGPYDARVEYAKMVQRTVLRPERFFQEHMTLSSYFLTDDEWDDEDVAHAHLRSVGARLKRKAEA